MIRTATAGLGDARLRAYAALALGILAISFSAIFVRWADAPGPVAGFYRMAIAMLILSVPFAQRLQARGGIPRREVWIAVLAGLFFGGDLVFWNTGIMLSGAANPTLLANTAPIWVALGAMLFFREQLNSRFWIGLAVAMSGAFAILGLDMSGDLGLGTFFGLLAGIFYGGYMLVTQRSRQALDVLSAFWLAGVTATLVLLVTALLLGQPLTGYPASTWWAFLALGVVTQVIGQFSVSYALGALPASMVSPTLLGQPALTVFWAALLLNEIPTIWHMTGAVLLLTGVYLVHRSRRPRY